MSAIRGVGRHSGPPTGGVLRVRLLEPTRRAHLAVLVRHPFRVPTQVDREEHLLADLGAFHQHGVDHVGRRLLETGERGQLRDIVHVMQQKADIVEWCLVGGHGRASSGRDNSGADLLPWKLWPDRDVGKPQLRRDRHVLKTPARPYTLLEPFRRRARTSIRPRAPFPLESGP